MVNIIFLFGIHAVSYQTPSPNLHCGSYCLYAGLKSLELQVPQYGEFEHAMGQPTRLGYSMQQLKDTALKYGAGVEAVETSLEKLRERNRPFVCLVLMNESHFVLISDITNDTVFLIDPPAINQANAEAFSKLWSGKALIITNIKLQTKEREKPFYKERIVKNFGSIAIVLTVFLVSWGVYYARSYRR